MLKFISFGSGSSGNSYLLMSDNTILMLDSGVGIRSMKRYFQEYGLSFTKINAILVTHDHADHVKSVGAISNDFKIPVYATEDSPQRNTKKLIVYERKLMRQTNGFSYLEMTP
mgnify:CR=1 FL=1